MDFSKMSFLYLYTNNPEFRIYESPSYNSHVAKLKVFGWLLVSRNPSTWNDDRRGKIRDFLLNIKSTACPLCQFHFKQKKHMAFVRSRARAEERQITAHDWQIPQVKMLNLWATSFRKFSKLCQTLPSCVDFCWQVVFLFFCPQSVLFSLLDYETSIIVLKKPAEPLAVTFLTVFSDGKN